MSKQLKVGLFALLAVGVFIAGMNFLKGSGFFDRSLEYYAVFDEVNGLYPSDPVMINGYQIGRIKEIDMIVDGPDKGKLITIMKLEPKIEIPKDSRAILFSSGFIGEMGVKILSGESAAIHQPGDTISTEIEQGMLADLSDEITPLTDQLQETINNVNTLFDPEGKDKKSINYTILTVNETLGTFNEAGMELTGVIKKQSETIDAMLKNMESITANLESNNESITTAIENIRDLSDTLKQIDLATPLETANRALARIDSVVVKFDDPNNSIGALLTEKDLYDNLEESTANLELLLEDLRVNPGRYVHFSLINRQGKEKRKKKEK